MILWVNIVILLNLGFILFVKKPPASSVCRESSVLCAGTWKTNWRYFSRIGKIKFLGNLDEGNVILVSDSLYVLRVNLNGLRLTSQVLMIAIFFCYFINSP